MPLGFLIPLALPVLITAAALAPVPRSWRLGHLTWRLGFQVNELPLVVAALILAATALTAAQGDLITPAGMAGACVVALILVGLLVVLRRGLRARPITLRALAAGLGSRWRAELPAELAARIARHRPWARLVFAPLAVRRHDVVRLPNIPYGPAGRSNLLDVYRPRSGAATGPCLVYFHGGGYLSGRKNRECRALIYRLASQGWVCVSANYRLARTAAYPAQLIDAKRAIAWMREHAADYGADSSTILIAGSSAGAHLAAMAALTPNAERLQPGFEHVDTHVSGAICLYGFYGTPTWINREPGAPSAPVDLLDHNAPPMLIAHGTRDSFVAVNVARDFVNRFRTVAPQRSMVYLELPGAQHTFDLYNSFRFHAVTDAIEAFTAHVTATSTGR